MSLRQRGEKYRKLTLTKVTQIFVITMRVTFQFQAFSKHILSSISHYLDSSAILHCSDIWFSVALQVPHCQYLKYLCSENLYSDQRSTLLSRFPFSRCLTTKTMGMSVLPCFFCFLACFFLVAPNLN